MAPPIICPACGSPDWRRVESGNYTEFHRVYTGPEHVGERHTWEDQEQDLMDSGAWECQGAHHPAPPEIAEQLDEDTP